MGALLSLSSSSTSSCGVSAFTFLAATKAVAPTKGGKEAKIVKEKPAAKKEKQEKKIKLGVDKNKKDKKKIIVAKKKEPPAKKKKIIPKVSDPSLELTRKL